MSKVRVIYWTQTGNTQAMAEAVARGIEAGGKEAELLEVGAADADALKADAAFALGCPAMGDEELEDSEVEPFVEQVESFANGKTVLLFGSYDWGDGEWMRKWTERMQNAGATVLGGEGIIANLTPDDDVLAKLEAAGKELAALA